MKRILSINENYGPLHFADEKFYSLRGYPFQIRKIVCFTVPTEPSLSIHNARRSFEWTVWYTHGLLIYVDTYTYDAVAKSLLKHYSCKVFKNA